MLMVARLGGSVMSTGEVETLEVTFIDPMVSLQLSRLYNPLAD